LNKTIIAPIIGFVVLVLQLFFGVELPEEVVNEVIIVIGNVVAVVFVLKGIIQNHLREKRADAQE